MELICYTIKNFNTFETQEEESKVQLVLNQEGEEQISHYQEQTVFHNSTIRNIIPKNGIWENYFKIYYDESLKGVVVRALKYGQYKLIKSKD